jgi:copper chaperone NosL
MNAISRYLAAAAALVLVLIFVFPLWKITLKAPQYPEGKGLLIWSDKITGVLPHDLQTINELNHYIGMKKITPATIKELKLMPFIVAFFSVTGVGVACRGGKKLLLAWIVLFAVTGMAGLYDFYSWEHDYGHDLDPKAPIRVPGMTYQPPLVGSKQLLNITARSMPDLGAFAVFVSIALAGLACIVESREEKSRGLKGEPD